LIVRLSSYELYTGCYSWWMLLRIIYGQT